MTVIPARMVLNTHLAPLGGEGWRSHRQPENSRSLSLPYVVGTLGGGVHFLALLFKFCGGNAAPLANGSSLILSHGWTERGGFLPFSSRASNSFLRQTLKGK